MTVEHVDFIVEEASAEAALRVLLPTMLPSISFQVYRHLSKDDLLQQLPNRLRGYSKWLPPAYRIVVVVDRDDDDCEALKSRLEKIAAASGLSTRSNRQDGQFSVVNRIAIEELEAWFFGDWAAVVGAYPRCPSTIPKQAKFRRPDEIAGGTWEALERILQSAGYFAGGLRKIEAARTIAALMDPDRNTSPSFRALRDALAEMAA